MSTPFTPEPKFFEHPKYAEFLVSLGTEVGDFNLSHTDRQKQIEFNIWLKRQETQEDIEDFKNMVHMRISMNTEEWNWFVSKLEDEEAHLPNLKALANHPPKGFKDLD